MMNTNHSWSRHGGLEPVQTARQPITYLSAHHPQFAVVYTTADNLRCQQGDPKAMNVKISSSVFWVVTRRNVV